MSANIVWISGKSALIHWCSPVGWKHTPLSSAVHWYFDPDVYAVILGVLLAWIKINIYNNLYYQSFSQYLYIEVECYYWIYKKITCFNIRIEVDYFYIYATCQHVKYGQWQISYASTNKYISSIYQEEKWKQIKESKE